MKDKSILRIINKIFLIDIRGFSGTKYLSPLNPQIFT